MSGRGAHARPAQALRDLLMTDVLRRRVGRARRAVGVGEVFSVEVPLAFEALHERPGSTREPRV